MKIRRDYWSRGVPMVWGTGSMVALSILMIAGLMFLVAVNGLEHFWPQRLDRFTTTDGDQFIGRLEAHLTEEDPASEDVVVRSKYKIGSRDVYGLDFRWFADSVIVSRQQPEDIVAVERESNGDLYGYVKTIHNENARVPTTASTIVARLSELVDDARRTADLIHDYEHSIASEYRPLNDKERLLTAARLPQNRETPDGVARMHRLQREVDSIRNLLTPRVNALHERINELSDVDRARYAVFTLADDREVKVPLSDIVRVWQPNTMGFGARLWHYMGGIWAFVSEDPREANTSGGIFPAIYGTVLMVLLMTIAVVPLGVVAALYLHEYAADNWMVRAVRLAVNNLAGVPSIVFGVFGLGFFVYFVGAGLDRLFFPEYLPSPTFGTGGILWASLTLALLTVPVVIVATEEGLSAVPNALREGALALGATKFQTIRRIVIPHAMPGILTGVILAIARGAGEVAPLMLTGVVPLATDYPLDATFPFMHLERKFLHLGFHIYDVGFQSPNVEAVKPLVYSTTLVLILLVVVLNLAAIILRNRLRTRFRGASV